MRSASAAERTRGVGPIRRPEDEEAIDLPFSPDPSRPLVFATMGTLQGGSLDLWRGIAEACRMAEAQFVIAHGGKLRDEDLYLENVVQPHALGMA